MLNLSAPTRLSAGEVMSKAHEYTDGRRQPV